MGELVTVGEVIDGFRIGERVFEGGAAYIHEVTHPEHPGRLLMKVPRIGVDQPTAGIIGFEMECMILPRLRGPHVPRVVACGALDRVPYLVMERIDGVTLSERVVRGGLPPEEVARIGIALATAVHSLHRQDVIHLDVKPGNILIRPDGEAVLVDFGFSHHARLPDLFKEENRKAVGSGPYIAPEQVLGVRNDARSDQFAIGVTLYELASGELPFGVPVTTAEMRNRLWVQPTPLRAMREDFPPWLQEIILTCLEPRADARYGSAAILAQALAHPDSVTLTRRGRATRRPGFWKQLARALRHRGEAVRVQAASPSEQLESVPMMMVAIDPEGSTKPMLRAIAYAVGRVLGRHPRSHLSCVSVIEGAPVQETAEAAESVRHHERLIALSDWAHRLGLPEDRLSLHVFESNDPAARLLRYAEDNQVDVLILGAARRSRNLRRSVMTRIAEEASCSVHIIRPVDEPEADAR